MTGQDEDLQELSDESLPNVSVIVPAFNEEAMLAKCIDSLLGLDYPSGKLEIIVVNDGSSDGTEKIAQSYSGHVKLVNLGKNSGHKAVPLNIGLKHAKGEFVACLDADSVVASDALRKMLPHFTEDKVAAVTPALKVFHPGNLIQKLQWFEYIFAIFLRRYMAAIDSIYVTPGPFTVYRKNVITEIGGFDEQNITEDMEIALRMQSKHYKIANAFDANVYSFSPETISELYLQRRRWYHGLLSNSIKYKHLFFNRSYGDFGILMPLNVFSVVVLMVSTFLVTYYAIQPLWRRLVHFYLIDFDFLTLLRDLHLNIAVLDVNYVKLWVILAVLAMGVVTLIVSHRISREKIRKYGFKPLGAFMLFYFLFLGYIWIAVISNLVINRNQKW
ncbi:MAG: glycosyltransferase family 2 protein [Candidatus Altiarchaeota archaeon]